MMNTGLKGFILLIIVKFIGITCYAQDLELIKDINTINQGAGFDPSEQVFYNNVMIFSGQTISDGAEPWVSDGSSEGTFILRDLNLGAFGSSPEEFSVTDFGVFFVARTTQAGEELCFTDGTTEGTGLFFDLFEGPEDSDIHRILPLGDKILFFGNHAEEGYSIWESDGTAEGTQLFMNPNNGGFFSVGIATPLNDQVIFASTMGGEGYQIWATDGTVDGTIPLFDNEDLPTTMVNPYVYNGELYFGSYVDGEGIELYKTDGTPEGSTLVKEINPGNLNADPNEFVEFNGELYFSARVNNYTQIWKTDGTEEGTVAITSFDDGFINAKSLAVLGDKLYFSVALAGVGHELFSTNGEEGNAELVVEVFDGAGNGEVENIFAWNEGLYFSAFDGSTGYELWKYTPDTEELLNFDLLSGGQFSSSSPRGFIAYNNLLFFIAKDAEGYEPWITDGTSGGTTMLQDINPTTDALNESLIHLLNDKIIFRARNEIGSRQLFVSSGTVESTEVITNVYPQATNRINSLFGYNGEVYFGAIDGDEGVELWKTDGTEEGTNLLADIAAGSAYSSPTNFSLLNGELYFSAETAEERNVYKLNNEGQPEIAFDVWAENNDDIADMIQVGNEIFFRADDDTGLGQGNDLWKSDGTLDGTVKVKDWNANGVKPLHSIAIEDRLWFQVEGPFDSGDWGMFTSDGTSEGTVLLLEHNYNENGDASFRNFPYNNGVFYLPGGEDMRELHYATETSAGLVKTINSLGENPWIINMVEANGLMYFIADDGIHGDELWVTDGTTEGTEMVIDLEDGMTSGALNQRIFNASYRQNVSAANNVVVFAGRTEDGDYELFSSDGTPEGTGLLMDINPYGGSNPFNFFQGENFTYFLADDGINGRELWRTNGTAEGTSLVANVAPGASSSDPSTFLEYNGYLYFLASIYSGSELFRIDQRCIIPEIEVSSESLCLSDQLVVQTDIIAIDGEVEDQSWDWGDDSFSTELTTDHLYSEPGNYTVTLQINSTSGCSYTQNFEISVVENPVPLVAVPEDMICLSAPWSPVDLSLNTENASYAWDFGAAGTSNEVDPEVEFPEIGEYSISLTLDNGSCAESFAFELETYLPSLDLVSATSPLCADSNDGSIEISGNSPMGDMSYSADGETFSAVGLFEGLNAGDFLFFAQDESGCLTELEVELEAPELLEADIEITNADDSENGVVVINGLGGTSPYMYSFEGSDFADVNTYGDLAIGNYTVSVQDANGCIYTTDVFVDDVNWVTEVNNSSVVKVYPNPSSEVIFIETPFTQFTLEVYDFSGRLVLYKNVNNSSAPLKIHLLNAGAYSMLISTGTKVFTEKLIVVN